MTINDPCSLSALTDALLNQSGKTSLAVRFRALFALKSLAADGNNKAVEIIAQGTLSFGTCLLNDQDLKMKVSY
jgi:hypothetical protein